MQTSEEEQAAGLSVAVERSLHCGVEQETAAGLGRQVGLAGGRQVSLCSSLIFSFSIFFCTFVDFLKIPRQL